MQRNGNENHPQKGSTIKVEPIKNRKDISTLPPAGHLRGRPPPSHGLLQPQHPATDFGLPLHPTGGDQRRV